MTLTFLGRCDNRWRVRVDLPAGVEVEGLTLALVGEDGRALGPLVVAPIDGASTYTFDLRGPCDMPPNTVVRCVADLVGGGALADVLVLDRRRGLHAFMHADARLPLESKSRGEGLSNTERRRLGAAFPWLVGCPEGVVAEHSVPEAEADPEFSPDPGLSPDILSMLRDDFGVELDETDADLTGVVRP